MNFYRTQNAQAFQDTTFSMVLIMIYVTQINPDSQKVAFGKNLLLLETGFLW